MTEIEMHGWSAGYPQPRTSWALHIGRLPGRKSYCLYEADGSVIRCLAYFQSEEYAWRALWAIDRVVWPADTSYEPFGGKAA